MRKGTTGLLLPARFAFGDVDPDVPASAFQPCSTREIKSKQPRAAVILKMPQNDIAKPAVFTSWKEIAAHLGKGARTAQRWEISLGLPVRRPPGASNRNIVMAKPAELDKWLATRWQPSVRNRGKADPSQEARQALKLRLQQFNALKQRSLALQQAMAGTVSELVSTCAKLQAGIHSHSRPDA